MGYIYITKIKMKKKNKIKKNKQKINKYKNKDKKSTYDLETLIFLYDDVKNDMEDKIEWTGDVINCLTNTVVKIYDENCGKSYKEIVEIKSYALRCLALAPTDLTDEFYEEFLNSFCDIVKSLNPFLITTSAYKVLENYIRFSFNDYEKLLVLNSIMICLAESTVNFEIFDNFSPNEWRKELLIFSLFHQCATDIDLVQHLIDKIITVMKNYGNYFGRRSLEDILEIIICNHRKTGFDIYFLHDIFVISRKPELLRMIFVNFPEIQNEIYKLKMSILSELFSTQVENLNNEIFDLQHYSKYPSDVLEILITKVPGNLEELSNLKRLFDCSSMDLNNQIKLILKLQPKESFQRLKFDVAFSLVKDLINVIFPAYKEYSWQYNEIHENMNIASTSTDRCTCFSSECGFHCSNEQCNLLYTLNTSLAKLILNCCEISTQVTELLGSLISRLMNTENIIQLINGLKILDDYEMKFTFIHIRDLFSLIDINNFEQEIHKHVIEKSFPGSYEKSLDQLFDEIEESYPGVTTHIVEMFHKLQNCYQQTSELLPDEGPIKSWNTKQIKMWVQLARFPMLQTSDEELLAVIKTAARVTVKLQLRHIQLISVLLMIKCNKGKGRLCQINTGEGKTLIIAALAAYNVFKGHTVDIYTSSPVLAIPQFKEYQNFYTVLSLTATHNINYDSNYNSNVIYGTNSSFQRDVLLDEFRKNGVRKSRKFDIAIVDEVDNMLIDGNNWILLLSCDMPAMDYLEVILAAIYIQVSEAARSLIEKDGKTYYLVQEIAIDNNGDEEISVEEVEIKGSKRDFIIECTETHLRKLIRDTEYCNNIEENYPEIKIPNHLREVICKVQLKRWISNAVNAFFLYVKDEDYILKDGKVTIVDADNTGSVKLNSQWSGGLHQFLEIKHGARVRPESFTTNFLSNVGLFSRYDSKLFGLTGTLGSKETKLFLQTTYDVDSVVIPPFKLKQHKHLTPILVNSIQNKYIVIAESCIRKLKHGQAALIIMKYIRETKNLADVFIKQFHYDNNKVKIVMTDDDSDFLDKPLCPGEVIITTNIAGRGTDVKLTKDVEQNGGLHVCLTFLPLNSRVEHQNIGRTSRKGNRGTSQLVVSDPQNFCDIESLKKIRNTQEANTIFQASKTVKKIKTKDRLFRKFCRLLHEITGREDEQTAVEERFAIWLLINANKIESNSDDIDESFDTFKKEILKDDRDNSLIKNPCILVTLGNKYLMKEQYHQAIVQYTCAIVLDQNFCEFAYYNRARAYLAKYGENMTKYEHFINEAISDLQNSRKLIEEKEYSLHLLQTASRGEVFSEQVSFKLNLYNRIKNTIDVAIGPDVNAIVDQIVKLEQELENENLSEDVKKEMNDHLNNLKAYKQEIGTIERAKRKNLNIEVNPLGDDFMPNADLETHKFELQELKRNGWIEGFKISEIKPIDWLTVISLLGIGLGQLLIGGALAVFTLGAGASVGLGLIMEGVGDIITAIKDGIIKRTFDWGTWALMKVISIAVSVVCAGFKAMKDVAKTAYSGAKAVVSKALTQTTKEGWKLVATKIGLDFAKGIGKEIVTNLVSYGIDKMILPMIEDIIVELVRYPIQHLLLNNTKVAAMLKLDLKNKNHVYENKIRDMAQELLSPEEYSKLETIATTIATQIADRKGLAITRQICTGIVGVAELSTFTSNFTKKLKKKIDGLEVDTNFDKDISQPEEEQLGDMTNQAQHDDACGHSEDDIDLSKTEKLEEQIQLERKPQTTDNLSNEIAGMVSKNVIEILKGKIIMPVVQMGVNYSVDKISSKVNECLETKLKNYRSKKNIIHVQNKAFTDSEKDSNKTFTDEEMKKVNEIVDELKKGGPAGLIHLGAISAAIDKPIEVYDENGKLKYTIGDIKKSKPLQVQYNPSENGSDVGHFTLKGQREPSNQSNSGNMCLFNVVAEQIGQTPDDLKNKTLNIMENNKNTVAKQVQHIIRLEMYDKSGLLQGGAQYHGTCPDDAKQYLINSNGVRGFKNKVPGHACIHTPFKGTTIDKLNAMAIESGHKIELYDENGKLVYFAKGKTDKDPIKLLYHKPEGDCSGEWISSINGNEKCYLHNPNDMNLYNIVGSQTGIDISSLHAAVQKRIDSLDVPSYIKSIETEEEKSGFVSLEEKTYVLNSAFQTDAVKQAMQELNEYKTGVKDSEQYYKKKIRISAKELNLSRTAYGGQWENGKLIETWPVTDVFLLLQHHKGQAENPNAQPHIQTFFPYRPKKAPQPPPK